MSSICGISERTWSENTGHKRTSRLMPIFYDMDMKKIEYITSVHHKSMEKMKNMSCGNIFTFLIGIVVKIAVVYLITLFPQNCKYFL